MIEQYIMQLTGADKYLVRYIRKGRKIIPPDNNNDEEIITRGIRKGIMISFLDCKTQQLLIGWSLCNKKDKFSTEWGLKIAINRAFLRIYAAIKPSKSYKTKLEYPVVPQSMQEDFAKFIIRSEKYFKKEYKGKNA